MGCQSYSDYRCCIVSYHLFHGVLDEGIPVFHANVNPVCNCVVAEALLQSLGLKLGNIKQLCSASNLAVSLLQPLDLIWGCRSVPTDFFQVSAYFVERVRASVSH